MIAIIGNIEFVDNSAIVHSGFKKLNLDSEEKITTFAEKFGFDYIIPSIFKGEIIFQPKNTAKFVNPPIVPEAWTQNQLKSICSTQM